MLACPDDVPTLENFAFGDTPTEASLRNLVAALLDPQSESEPGSGIGGPPPSPDAKAASSEPEAGYGEFSVNLYELGNRHDLRPLVLRTALTYLEIQGAIRQGTPFYAGYALRPKVPVEEIVGQFAGTTGRRPFYP
jgi:ATP-dependent DNA helicase RecQ